MIWSSHHAKNYILFVPSHSQNQQERLNYLEFKIYFTGQINRTDLMQRFGISEAAATRDLGIYRDEAPKNIELDHTTKFYRITQSFRLLYLKDVDPKILLRALVHGLGDDFAPSPLQLVPCELPVRLHAPDVTILATISRAIFTRRVISVEYLSESGGRGFRELVPFSFGGNGLRWHVRAYDRRKSRFGDFVINRIQSAIMLNGDPQPHELKEEDDEWNRMVNLEIVAHPCHPTKRAMTEMEYCMKEGVLKLKTRAALAGYVLRLWNVDCTESHNLNDKYIRLWLRNRLSLYGVENAKIAPGFAEITAE